MKKNILFLIIVLISGSMYSGEKGNPDRSKKLKIADQDWVDVTDETVHGIVLGRPIGKVSERLLNEVDPGDSAREFTEEDVDRAVAKGIIGERGLLYKTVELEGRTVYVREVVDNLKDEATRFVVQVAMDKAENYVVNNSNPLAGRIAVEYFRRFLQQYPALPSAPVGVPLLALTSSNTTSELGRATPPAPTTPRVERALVTPSRSPAAPTGLDAN